MRKAMAAATLILMCSSAFGVLFDGDAKYLCSGTQNVVFQKTWVLEYKDKAFSIDGQLLKQNPSDTEFKVTNSSIRIKSPSRSIFLDSGVLKISIARPNGDPHQIEAICKKV